MPTTTFLHLLDQADRKLVAAIDAVSSAHAEARLLADDAQSDETTRTLARMAVQSLGHTLSALTSAHLTVLV